MRSQADNFSGSHASIVSRLCVDYGFWLPQPILAIRTPKPIDDLALRTIGKERVVKLFSYRKEH